MILLVAILGGLVTGFVISKISKTSWRIPVLQKPWLVLFGFLPQFIGFYLPITRSRVSDAVAAAILVDSFILFLAFCWINRRITGVWLLAIGLISNLLVISLNQGFMPISRQTASRLVSPASLALLENGDRFGRKDILLEPEQTKLAWLSDWLLPPGNFPYQVAFSPGDVFLAAGAFWVTARQEKSPNNLEKDKE